MAPTIDDSKVQLLIQTYTDHVDLTVLSIFQKAVTFENNLTQKMYFLAFFNIFVGICILNEGVSKYSLAKRLFNFRSKHV